MDSGAVKGSLEVTSCWLLAVWDQTFNLSEGKAPGYMAMDQYLLIPFLMGWTSIYQLFWCELQGYYWFWHTAIWLHHFLHVFSEAKFWECPVSWHSARTSRGMKRFRCLKFRSIWRGFEEMSGRWSTWWTCVSENWLYIYIYRSK